MSSTPSVEIIRHDEEAGELVFRLRKVTLAFVSALRRVIYSEVPSLAIELVDFADNTSPLSEEVIAHRLGLVPLFYPEDIMTSHSTCTCDGTCENCEVFYTLNVMNDHETVMTVRSDELLPSTRNHVTMPGQAPIVLFQLGHNQRVHFKATARRGTGTDHAKWCPVNNATFVVEPEIILNRDSIASLSADDRHALVTSCPRQVFELNEISKSIKVVNADACMYCADCMELSNQFAQDYEMIPPVIVREPKDPVYRFTIESAGGVPPDVILSRALTILLGKIDLLQSSWSSLQQEKAFAFASSSSSTFM
ncbi:hypothetical protein RCL1_000945 [Eukaryota sp. TZLM3-RCL]